MNGIAQNLVTKTLSFRVKDRKAVLRLLATQAFAVNQVWNYCNELSYKHWQRKGEFLSAYDIQRYTNGASKELGLHSQTVQAITDEYVTRRKQFKRVKLRWRVSTGPKRSLGWIPFKASAIKIKDGAVQYGGQLVRLWDSYGIADYAAGPGSFSEDSRGRWYFNMVVKTDAAKSSATEAIGIDLGLKDLLVASDGQVVESARFYRQLEPALATAQRANKKQRVKAIHAKIKNRRKDALHKLSTRLSEEYGAIFVGNVNASGLAKTRMAKSVLDAGWSAFRTMLQHKCDRAGVWFEEVNEAYSTQTCSVCNNRTGPKGREGLGIREWTCECCDSVHHRDVNAARNILARGLAGLAEGIPGL